MKHLYRVGKQIVEMWHDEPPDLPQFTKSLMLWVGIMLTIFNILAAILVFG